MQDVLGGSGISLETKMPFDDGSGAYDRIMPDYQLYKQKFPKLDYAIGRFTRGCPNRCPWCVVWKMDGNNVRHVADLSDFWCGQPTVRLLDDNLLADPDEFISDCKQLSDAGVKVIWEALDIRLINDETARALATVKQDKYIHFAWDSHAQDEAVPRGIEILKRNGIRPSRLMFYVLIGFNTTPEYDMHRVMELRRMKAWPFVMVYNKDTSNVYAKHFQRWVNNRFVFGATDFDHYEPWVKARRQLEGGVTDSK